MKHPSLRFLKLIGFIAAFALLIAVIWRFDPARIASSLASAHPVYVILGLGLVQVQIVLSALRWRFTAARLGQKIGTGRAIAEYYLGTFLNQVLPGGVAGDALRAVRGRTGEAGGWKFPAQAVLFERIAGQGVFFFIAAFGMMLWPFAGAATIPDILQPALIGLSVFVALLVAVSLIILRFPPKLLRTRVYNLRQALLQVFIRDRAWVTQAAYSVVIVASYIAMFLLASAAVGAPLPAIAAITAVPLCLLVMLIPASIAGWGLREAAAAALWPLFGYTAAEGVAAAILYGLLALAGAAPGLVFTLVALLKRRRQGESRA